MYDNGDYIMEKHGHVSHAMCDERHMDWSETAAAWKRWHPTNTRMFPSFPTFTLWSGSKTGLPSGDVLRDLFIDAAAERHLEKILGMSVEGASKVEDEGMQKDDVVSSQHEREQYVDKLKKVEERAEVYEKHVAKRRASTTFATLLLQLVDERRWETYSDRGLRRDACEAAQSESNPTWCEDRSHPAWQRGDAATELSRSEEAWRQAAARRLTAKMALRESLILQRRVQAVHDQFLGSSRLDLHYKQAALQHEADQLTAQEHRLADREREFEEDWKMLGAAEAERTLATAERDEWETWLRMSLFQDEEAALASM
eukprot:gene9670-11463_t